MTGGRETTHTQITATFAGLAVLLVLCVCVFWRQVSVMASTMHKSTETAHAIGGALAILLLLYRRRLALAQNLTRGSAWALPFLIAGLALHAAAIWPFPYGYAHYAAIIPVLVAIILACCGWRVLKLTLPMLLLLALSFPLGSRIQEAMALRADTYTISAAAKLLDRLPGIDTTLDGADLTYSSSSHSGVIGLGEPNRGARLLLSFLVLGVFVAFSQIRSPWRIILLAIAAAPIALLCNFFRFLCWSLVVICTGLGPASAIPRSVSAASSLLLSYALFAGLAAIKLNLFIEDDESGEDSNAAEAPNGDN